MNLYSVTTGYLAQATYGEGNYGSELYQAGDPSSGTLSNTGTPIILGGTIGVALLISAVVLFVQSRKK